MQTSLVYNLFQTDCVDLLAVSNNSFYFDPNLQIWIAFANLMLRIDWVGQMHLVYRLLSLVTQKKKNSDLVSLKFERLRIKN